MGIGEAALHTPLTAPRARTAMLDTASSSGPGAMAHGVIHQRCWACEPAFRRRDARCAAVALLESLEADLEDVTRRLEHDEETEGADAAMRKATRYFMYRKWVGAQWGYLGRGKRIRIPLCVIEAIRDRFRAPGCDCALGGPLGNCVAHGYTGHRDAPGGSSDD